ncbi:MAG: oxidoreductase, partial [Bacteroidales bacterium]|nr:oxidoreductase [Bacteroidales bacterium]
GIHLHSMCRQIDGCSNNVSEEVHGTKGYWKSADDAIYDLQGNKIWEFDYDAMRAEFKQEDPYVLEHVDWVNHIRKGTAHDEASECGMSSLCGVMGREAAYTGQTIEWDTISASDLDYLPAKLEMGKMDMKSYTVAKPGTGK